ncbi:hypothetical protein HHL17_26400 [Chitinophaga sp. G-6-1-13]|uniref:Uncharacterized protein n=1 Tax=Chitinophaga fulva TaxID=2728842 RepID=A0A848GQE2_9BACT|nr:hypothetical protein [Chitinophaga fulva]NML40756.1 hypothetical protein [Chitinophaga fulva]
MKKIHILLFSTVVVAITAGTLASEARISSRIYLENPLFLGTCDVVITGKTITASGTDITYATSIPGPCDLVYITDAWIN